jgi:hypothetical protein
MNLAGRRLMCERSPPVAACLLLRIRSSDKRGHAPLQDATLFGVTGAVVLPIEDAVLARWPGRGAVSCERYEVPGGDGYSDCFRSALLTK